MALDDNPHGRQQLDAAQLAMLRVRRFARTRIAPAVEAEAVPVEVTAWVVGGEPVPFAVAAQQDFAPFALGDAWGRAWDTVWFDVRGVVPDGWDEAELVLDLGFNAASPGFQAEATAYLPDGTVIKGVEPRNAWVPLPGPGDFRVLVEAAANPVVHTPDVYEPTPMGDKDTAGEDLLYRLRRLEVVRRDPVVWELMQDVAVLDGLADVLPATGSRRAEVVHALERMVDLMDPDDVAGTAELGREVLAPVLAGTAPGSAIQVSAVGHAHIDCAWLWPVRETVRKVARTFANVLDLVERDPDFVFAASSAQQYAWVQEHYPEIFERIRTAVAAGRVRPVGGMWVESDTNMPGGEALVRQFVHGQRFFREELGVECQEVWLPDSFGYTAAMPQVARGAGCRWFLTQKPSWNETNAMPYSSFWWEGIDGSRVFTHFPPAETYNSDLGAQDLARTERRFTEKGRARHVLGLFGYGDGGGGPTREMLAAASRKRDLDGSPRVRLTDPASFFAAAEEELADAPVWTGEMYLELHRGTLVSQQRIKRGNRRSEALLREAELWCTAATTLRGAAYPYDELEAAWRTVLLNQFHDILPGTSIAWVVQEAERSYAEVAAALETLVAAALQALAGGTEGTATLVANAGPYERDGVPAMSVGAARPAGAAAPRRDGDGHVLEDDHLRVVVDARGTISSIRDLVADRELVPAGQAAAVLQLMRDTPREWDAWDINEEDQRSSRALVGPESVTSEGDAVVVRHHLGATAIEVRIRLVDGKVDLGVDVDWHESQKLLKLAFPLDLRTDRAASEIQFGHLQRPVHRNTSWDTARFETVAHRWIHVGEPDYGVAIANDVVYGHDVRTGRTEEGRPTTVVRLSLLRAPRFPDPHADQGRHRFTVSLRPGGIPDAVRDGYAQQLPLRPTSGAVLAPFLEVDAAAIVVESVKAAEDRSGDVVVRLYEAHGTRARGVLRTAFPWASVTATDLLERRADQGAVLDVDDGAVRLELRPFQVVTLRFRSLPSD